MLKPTPWGVGLVSTLSPRCHLANSLNNGGPDLSNFATRLEGRDQVTKMYREMYLVGFLLRKPLA